MLKMGTIAPLKRKTTKLVWGWLLLIVLWAVFMSMRNTPAASLQELKASASDILESSGNLIKGSFSAGPWSLTADVWHPEEEFYQQTDQEEDKVKEYDQQPADEEYKEEQYQAARPNVDDTPRKAQYRPRPTAATKGSQSEISQSGSWDLATFQRQWLSVELGGAFDGSHLLHLCNATTWRTDVVLQMLHARGGIANVRGTILDFLHLAIRVGASHVVLPQYAKRADASLDWTGTETETETDDESRGEYWPFDTLFDADWVVGVVDSYCPQMTVYRTLQNAPHEATVQDLFRPRRARPDKAMDESVAASVAHFAAWLEQRPAGYRPGRRNLVSTAATMLSFDMRPYPRMRTTLGRLLRVNPVIRELAAAAVYGMRAGSHGHGHGHGLDTIDPRQEVYEGAYYGMHLRTEKQQTAAAAAAAAAASKAGWAVSAPGGFERQTDAHLAHCQRLGLRVIYAAMEDEEDVLRFADKAMKQANITVVSKHNLVTEPQHVAALRKLTWDQRGALDWEILARSTFFSGPVTVSPCT